MPVKVNKAFDLKKASLQELREITKDKSGKDLERTFAAALDLKPLTTYEAALLTVVQRVNREGRGSGTPVEEFLDKLLRTMMHIAPTAEEIQEDVDELKGHWECALKDVRRFYRDYRDLVTLPEADMGKGGKDAQQ